jgi:hypothetical protein
MKKVTVVKIMLTSMILNRINKVKTLLASASLFFLISDTNKWVQNKTKNGLMLTIYCTPAPPVLLSLNSRILR